jgi:hypothetical protein
MAVFMLTRIRIEAVPDEGGGTPTILNRRKWKIFLIAVNGGQEYDV